MSILAAWYDLRSLANPFDHLYSWLGDHASGQVVYVVSSLIGALGVLTFIGIGAVINSWIERRVIGRMQVRRGPNRVGPFGLLQPIADAIKLIQKEVLQPRAADNALFGIPPFLVFIPPMLTFAVFAWAPNMVYANLNVGVLFILAVSSIGVLAIFIAGWSSNNKWALFGGMRVIAMMISYEVPFVLSLLAPVIFAGSMSIADIVAWQRDHHVWLFVLLPIPTVVYGLCATAELNRTPMDIAEAESEIVAGYHTEYSGMKFGLFYAVELVNSLAASAVMATLFFGGYWLFGIDKYVPPWLIFIAKVYAFYFGLIWLRGTWPRLRIDQLMAFAWKMLLPLALVNVLIVAVEVLIWREFDITDWILLPFALINIALAAGLIAWWFRFMTAGIYRLPRRVRLFHDIAVPSLPAPAKVVQP